MRTLFSLCVKYISFGFIEVNNKYAKNTKKDILSAIEIML